MHILQISTKSSKCFVSIRPCHNIGPTWGQLRPATPQHQLAPTSAGLGSKMAAIWEQIRPKLVSIWLQNGGHDRPNPKSSRRPLSLRSIFMSCIFHVFVAINDAPHVVSPLGPTLCEAVTKGAKLRHVRTDLDHVHHTASTWSASGSLWVQLQPNMKNWRQRALQLYPRQRGQVGPFTGSPGPS